MLNAILLDKEYITETLFFLRVKPDDGVSEFIPGQYIALGLPGSAPRAQSLPPEQSGPADDGLIRRTYSIGSSPEQKEFYEFYIAILPQGLLTARLAALEVGDRLFVGKKPIGTFTLNVVSPDKPVSFIATGTGVAPFVSMLKTETTWARPAKMTLVHGVRYSSDLAYGTFLEDLATKYPDQFVYHKIISRDENNWPGHRGYVQDLVTKQVVDLDVDRDQVMLCGNPGMIDQLQNLLIEKGFSIHSKQKPGNIFLEKYW